MVRTGARCNKGAGDFGQGDAGREKGKGRLGAGILGGRQRRIGAIGTAMFQPFPGFLLGRKATAFAWLAFLVPDRHESAEWCQLDALAFGEDGNGTAAARLLRVLFCHKMNYQFWGRHVPGFSGSYGGWSAGGFLSVALGEPDAAGGGVGEPFTPVSCSMIPRSRSTSEDEPVETVAVEPFAAAAEPPVAVRELLGVRMSERPRSQSAEIPHLEQTATISSTEGFRSPLTYKSTVF